MGITENRNGNYSQVPFQGESTTGGKLGITSSTALTVFLAFMFFILVYFGCYKAYKRPVAVCKVAVFPMENNGTTPTGFIIQPYIISPYDYAYAGTFNEAHGYPATHGFQRGSRSRLPPLMPFPRQICADGEIPPQGDPTSVAQISSGNDKEDTIPPPPYFEDYKKP